MHGFLLSDAQWKTKIEFAGVIASRHTPALAQITGRAAAVLRSICRRYIRPAPADLQLILQPQMNILPGRGCLRLFFKELREIQRQYGYLPADQLKNLAKKIDVPALSPARSCSFYPHFRLTPPPKADVRVCQDMSCHLRGAGELRAELDAIYQKSPKDGSPGERRFLPGALQ